MESPLVQEPVISPVSARRDFLSPVNELVYNDYFSALNSTCRRGGNSQANAQRDNKATAELLASGLRLTLHPNSQNLPVRHQENAEGRDQKVYGSCIRVNTMHRDSTRQTVDQNSALNQGQKLQRRVNVAVVGLRACLGEASIAPAPPKKVKQFDRLDEHGGKPPKSPVLVPPPLIVRPRRNMARMASGGTRSKLHKRLRIRRLTKGTKAYIGLVLLCIPTSFQSCSQCAARKGFVNSNLKRLIVPIFSIPYGYL